MAQPSTIGMLPKKGPASNIHTSCLPVRYAKVGVEILKDPSICEHRGTLT